MWPLVLLACAPAPDSTSLPVRWVAEPGEDLDSVEDGLAWGLGSLGAMPQRRLLRDVEIDADGARAWLDLEAIGAAPSAEPAWEAAFDALLASDEIAMFGGVDLGRVAMRWAYDPWTYYALTGACDRFEPWQERFEPEEPAAFAATVSSVSHGQRQIWFDAAAQDVSELRFLAWGGEGSLEHGSFVPRDAEVAETLPNGQLRFATYDSVGELIPMSDPELSAAGQPGTCQWCHEGAIQPAFVETLPVEGHLDSAAWNVQVARWNLWLTDARVAAGGPDPAHHDAFELLAEAFVEPDVARLAREWGMPEAEVQARVAQRLRDGQRGLPIVPRADADAIWAVWSREIGRGEGFSPPAVQPWPRSYDPASGAETEAEMREFRDCRDPWDNPPFTSP